MGFTVEDELQVGIYRLDCVYPTSKILTSDLKWVNAESIEIGQSLVGFDEIADGRNRHLQEAEVIAVEEKLSPCVEIFWDDGSSTICSEGHGWLAAGKQARGIARKEYLESIDLRIGWNIRRITRTWDMVQPYEAGWLGGFFDGEGTVNSRGLSAGQYPNPALLKAKEFLNTLGFEYGEYGRNVDRLINLSIYGGWPERLRFLGQTRPDRLIEKKAWVGAALSRSDPIGTVQGIRKIGKQKVISIQTSTGTLVVDGMASHNCYVRELHMGFECDGKRIHAGVKKQKKDGNRDEWVFENAGIPVMRIQSDALQFTLWDKLKPLILEFISKYENDIEKRREKGLLWDI